MSWSHQSAHAHSSARRERLLPCSTSIAMKKAQKVVLDRLLHPMRARTPWARPVLPLVPEDPARATVPAEWLHATAVLERRGHWHGEWADLNVQLPGEPEGVDAFLEECVARWQRCEPVVLQGCFTEVVEQAQEWLEDRELLRERLSEPGGLREWLFEQLDPESGFEPLQRARTLVDPERDIEKVRVAAGEHELWLKSACLSTYPEDASLRLRTSFGAEGDDDASHDIQRHRLVTELAQTLFPEAALVLEDPFLRTLLRRATGMDVLATQHIAYWNAPQGGAQMHHDAFAEDAWNDGAFRQLGVCYVQFTGRTAWIAVSTEGLCSAVREFAALLRSGAMPWVSQVVDQHMLSLVDDDERLRTELALPGCGALHALVERGPEFTNLLAERGHAFLLEAGDGILLPNRGLHSTCMHSVWCAGDEVAYSLSMALRPDRAAPQVDAKAMRRQRRLTRKDRS